MKPDSFAFTLDPPTPPPMEWGECPLCGATPTRRNRFPGEKGTLVLVRGRRCFCPNCRHGWTEPVPFRPAVGGGKD